MPRMNSSIPKVPVGTTTVTGYGTSLTLFVLAAAAFLTGDRSQQTIGTVVAGALGGVLFVATSAGRYVQAHALTKYGDQHTSLAKAAEVTAHRAQDVVAVVGQTFHQANAPTARTPLEDWPDDPVAVHADETAPPPAELHDQVAAAESAREPVEQPAPMAGEGAVFAPPPVAEQVPAAEARDLHDAEGA